MIMHQWERALKDVISEVLETMFFTVVDFEVESTGAPFRYQSEIVISGKKGRIAISLRVTGQFARMITANLIGVDEEGIGEADIEDALKEFINMIGGNYHVPMKDYEWSLGIPQAWEIDLAGQEPGITGSTGLCFGCFGEEAGYVSLQYHEMADGPG